MDGSIVIGVALDSSEFEAALQRLRQEAGQRAVKAVENLINSLRQLDSSFYASASAAQRWSSSLTGVFNATVSSAAAVVPRLGDMGRQAGAHFVAGVLQADTARAGVTLGQGLVQGIQAVNYRYMGSWVAYALAQGMADASGTFTMVGTNLAYRIQAAFNGGWYNLGYNISAGIAQGLLGGSSLITNAAIAAAKRALYAAKQSLGVRSPSRVFRDQVGRMIPAGIAQGIGQGTEEVEAAVKQQSLRLVETARRDVAPVVSYLPSGQQAPVRQAQSPISVHLEAPLVVDGREIARATARYTGEQMLWEGMA